MKNLYKVLLLIIFANFTLKADVYDNIKFAIKKSRPELLKKALENTMLTNEQKADFVELAIEVCRMRENKMNINLFKRKFPNNPGGLYKLGAVLLVSSVFMGCAEQSRKSDDNIILNVLSFALLGTLSIWGAKKLWKKGDELDIEFYKTYRSPKQKYLDSLEVKHLLANF